MRALDPFVFIRKESTPRPITFFARMQCSRLARRSRGASYTDALLKSLDKRARSRIRYSQREPQMQFLKKLIETPGVPGREERVRDLIVQETKGLFDETRIDGMG